MFCSAAAKFEKSAGSWEGGIAPLSNANRPAKTPIIPCVRSGNLGWAVLLAMMVNTPMAISEELANKRKKIKDCPTLDEKAQTTIDPRMTMMAPARASAHQFLPNIGNWSCGCVAAE